jgi:hypothetical protein
MNQDHLWHVDRAQAAGREPAAKIEVLIIKREALVEQTVSVHVLALQ